MRDVVRFFRFFVGSGQCIVLVKQNIYYGINVIETDLTKRVHGLRIITNINSTLFVFVVYLPSVNDIDIYSSCIEYLNDLHCINTTGIWKSDFFGRFKCTVWQYSDLFSASTEVSAHIRLHSKRIHWFQPTKLTSAKDLNSLLHLDGLLWT